MDKQTIEVTITVDKCRDCPHREFDHPANFCGLDNNGIDIFSDTIRKDCPLLNKQL